jgi:hypothetical protein
MFPSSEETRIGAARCECRTCKNLSPVGSLTVQVIPSRLQFRHQSGPETCLSRPLSVVVLRLRDLVMRLIAVLAVLSMALLPLGGCFFHHNQAVVTQPLPPLK